MSSTSFPFIPNEFIGKRALVTGGTQGMGEAIVNRLARGGARIVTTARSTPATPLRSDTSFVQADLSTPEGCDHVIHEVLSRLRGVDIVINVVGGSSAPSGGFAVLTDQEWQTELNLNLFPAVRLDRGLLPSMLKQKSGVIIHISSIQRKLPLHEATLAYAAAQDLLRLPQARQRPGLCVHPLCTVIL